MATGRDDFVIAIRSAFLKKGAQQRFSLIGLIFFSLLLIIFSRLNFKPVEYLKIGLNEIVYRVSFVVSLPEQQFNIVSKNIINHFVLYRDFEETKKKLLSLSRKNIIIIILYQKIID